MDFLQELNKLKSQTTEFEATINKLIAYAKTQIEGNVAIAESYETPYKLNTPTVFFKGKKPTGIIFPNGVRKNVSTWKNLVKELLLDCVKNDERKNKLLALRGIVAGRNRVFVSNTDENMRSAIKVDNYLFVETHYDTETLLHIVLYRILAHADYDFSEIQVTLKNE